MDDLIPLIDVPKLLPKRNGKSVHIRTVRRWVTKGLKDRRLEAVRIGGRYYVSWEALKVFIAGPDQEQRTADPKPVALSSKRSKGREAARRRAREIFGLSDD